jgi:MinD-like ATPase involved in chromosome partitioning or flagellar assembly
MYRTEPVIALDANPTYGNLGRLIDPDTRSSIREFIADPKVTSSYPKTRCHTGKNKQGLEVLAGNQNLANPFALDADTFTDTLARTQRFYQLSLIDCGHEIEHPVMSAVLEAVDALVIVGAMNFDGVGAAEQTLDWLDARNKHDLLGRSMLVLNDVYRCRSMSFVAEVRNSLGPRVGELKTIPWDRHLRDGAVLDFEALRRRTQLAYIEVAAWLAQGFASGGVGAR